MSVAFLFSPQGSQAIGMGRSLADASQAARAVFHEADDTLGWSVSATCWKGPTDRLDDTRQTQPCLLTTSIASLRALEERGVPAPSAVAGHSVGEYAALVAAGVLAFPAALRLVARRGELMAAADAEGGMAAVIGLDRAAVEAIVDAHGNPTELVVANDNAPGQIVISGRREAIAAVQPSLSDAGARRVIPLPVSGAFHSPLMAEVAEQLAEAFEAETWADARIPVVSNVTAEPLTDASRLRALLAEQVRSPVEWVRVVGRLRDDGTTTVVELGAGAALVGMVKRIAPELRGLPVNDEATLDAAVAALGAGVPA